jgi:hypothetical protein
MGAPILDGALAAEEAISAGFQTNWDNRKSCMQNAMRYLIISIKGP